MTRFSALNFHGLLLFLSWSSLGLGQEPDLITPIPRAGWKVTWSPELRMTGAALADAPKLAPWPEHGPERAPEEGPAFQASAAWEAEWLSVVAQAVQIANDHLPEPFRGDFSLWVFSDIPYAARSVWPDLVLSSRILSPGQRKRLPWVLAHEVHHLALMRSGFLTPQPTASADILAGLLSEGLATWMCWSSGLFPELEAIVEDSETLSRSFSQLKRALEDVAGNGASAPDLYHQNKWGYYAGSWMVREIHRRFGKQPLMEMLAKPVSEATAEMVDLYRSTQPAPEFSF